MKVLQIGPGRETRILDLPVPVPQVGEALVRIDAVTTCPQWDLHLRHNEPMFLGHQFHYPYTPGQPGHEATGIVEALGEGVTSLEVGDRVSVWRDPGHDVNGCYAQYVARPVEHLIRVPEGLSPQAVAPIELAMCVGASFLQLKQMNQISGSFAVNGLGPAGLIAAQMARAEGAAEIIGFDLSPTRREFAVSHGIVESAHDPASEGCHLTSRPALPMLDVGIDCVGAKRSVEWLMDHVRDVVALFGVQREDYTYAPRHYGGLTLVGYPGHSRKAAEYAVDLISRGLLDLELVVTCSLPLERYADGIDLLESQQAIKVCYLPWA